MGQRTHFVIVAEDRTKNRARVTIYYHHWGIGRNMPIALMSLIGNVKAYDRCSGKEFLNNTQIDFNRLGFLKEEEIEYENGVAWDTKFPIQNFADWRNPKIAGEYMKEFDNNNGCLFAFITYDFNEDTYEKTLKKEIAWMIGREDANYILNGIERNIENKRLGGPYEKWLSTRQWMSIDVNDTWWGKDREFKELFNRFLAYFEVLPINKPRKARNAA